MSAEPKLNYKVLIPFIFLHGKNIYAIILTSNIPRVCAQFLIGAFF